LRRTVVHISSLYFRLDIYFRFRIPDLARWSASLVAPGLAPRWPRPRALDSAPARTTRTDELVCSLHLHRPGYSDRLLPAPTRLIDEFARSLPARLGLPTVSLVSLVVLASPYSILSGDSLSRSTHSLLELARPFPRASLESHKSVDLRLFSYSDSRLSDGRTPVRLLGLPIDPLCFSRSEQLVLNCSCARSLLFLQSILPHFPAPSPKVCPPFARVCGSLLARLAVRPVLPARPARRSSLALVSPVSVSSGLVCSPALVSRPSLLPRSS
jgi:hypothetical protein